MTPDLQLRTLYVLDEDGRLSCTREPGEHPPPAFVLIRSNTACAWAIAATVDRSLAGEVERLVRDEPLLADLRTPPAHADRYLSRLGSRVESGPAFVFPDDIDEPDGVVMVDDAGMLAPTFPDLVGEFEGRSPVFVVMEDGRPVSACYCARRSSEAAEAGLHTLERYRGRGHGPRVVAAWAREIRDSGRVPFYSTSWTNEASRAVARKLGLVAYASDWSVY